MVIGADEAISDPLGLVFSPDSRELAFTVNDGSTWRLLARDLQSGATRTILEGPIAAESADAEPWVAHPLAWIPSGLLIERVLWGTDKLPWGLTLVDPATGTQQPIRAKEHLSAAISPDGQRVAVVKGSAPIGEPPRAAISVINVGDLNEITVVREQQLVVKALHWSPDGSKLLYAGSEHYLGYTPVTKVHVLSADGSNEQAFGIGTPSFKPAYGDLAWQDDQTALLLSPQDDGYVHLYKLPLASFDVANLEPLAAFVRESPNDRVDEIIYTPN
jgi:hypothetical protein